ncbi:ATP-binding protein [Rubrivirga sp. IMCC43871]|uniref:ATP-binding protein n=1 Tax=Rubrivirga sp. IMCC43871 TaxID=3391575 RepID=UPI00398FE9F0
MPSFSLSPEVVPLVCQALMAGLAGAYLLSIRRKTRSAWWLTALFAGNLIFALCFALATIAPSSATWSIRFSIGLYVGVGVAGFAGLRLAYTFLARPFRREERIVSAVAALALAGLLAATAVAQVTLAEGLLEPLLYAYGAFLLATTIGALAVHLRQAERLGRLSRSGPRASARRSSATGHRAMAGLSLLIVVLASINALSTVGVLPPLAIQYSSLLFELVLDVGLIVVFINHAPEPTTVQAKLVGITLGVMLALLGLTSMALLRPAELAQAAGNRVPTEVTVRFQPDDGGGYAVTRAVDTGRIDAAPRGAPAAADQWLLRLPFDFPIGGERYREVGLTPLPYLAFDEPEPCTLFCIGIDDQPRPDHPMVIAFALPLDIDALGPPRVAASPDRLDVHWEILGTGGERSAHRATLWPDGTVEIAYRGPRRFPTGGSAGLLTGSGEVQEAAFAWESPATLAPGTSLVDPYGARYAPLAQGRTVRMLGLVLGATLVVILLIPVFLRRGVLDPIAALTAGLERVDRGRRGVRLSVRTNDEMGLLARRFNAMMASLETAEGSLRDYADALESRVSDRTRSLRDAVDALGRQRDALEQSLADLREAQGRLVQAEKLASLGRLTAGIAHEIKNPLNFVTNFADLSVELTAEIGDDLRADPERSVGDALPDLEPLLADLADNAERIRDHGRLADRIVQGMMLHARGQNVEHVPSDVNGLLRLAAEGTPRSATDPAIDLDLDPAVGTVAVAAEGIVQLTLSLINNALDATADAPSPVTVRSRREGDAVTIQVADLGMGMDPETQARAFEPFYTTKAPGEGTGLGLSLAYDIVTAGHGGTIDLETAPGAGTTVTVILPAPRTSAPADLPDDLDRLRVMPVWEVDAAS